MRLVNQSVRPLPFTYPVSQGCLAKLLPTPDAVITIRVYVTRGPM